MIPRIVNRVLLTEFQLELSAKQIASNMSVLIKPNFTVKVQNETPMQRESPLLLDVQRGLQILTRLELALVR